MSEKIKLCIYNAQSITNKFITVMQFIQDNKIDIFCINETFLTNKITNINLLNNYTLIRQDRDKRVGGVAIIINKRIQYNFLKSKSTNDYEYIAIEITASNEKITILNSYTHPQSKTNFSFVDSILRSQNRKIIWVGDLNAKNTLWHCNGTN